MLFAISGFRFALAARPIGTLRLLAGSTSSSSPFTAMPPPPLHRPTAVIISPPHIPPSAYPRFAGYALRVYSRPSGKVTNFPARSVRDHHRDVCEFTHTLSPSLCALAFPPSRAINFIDREGSIYVLASWGLTGHSPAAGGRGVEVEVESLPTPDGRSTGSLVG